MSGTIDFLKRELPHVIQGDVAFDDETRTKYSRDASIFSVRPQAVVFPKDSRDIQALVRFVSEHTKEYAGLSLAVRAAGTCMSGGSLSESIVVDTAKYMHGVVRISPESATVLPGTPFKELEAAALAHNAMLPCFPASKNLCALGGMIGNNCAGEKSLKYGHMRDYISEVKIILHDGNEYTVRPLSKEGLEQKMHADTVEGELYRKLHTLIAENRERILAEEPQTAKNSAGYYLWDVEQPGGIFDLNKIIVGSQGTLGFVTEATVRLVPITRYSRLVVIFMPDIQRLGELVNEILPFRPEGIESFDDTTIRFVLKFLPDIMKSMKGGIVSLAWRFLPEAWMALRGGIPKLILLVSFTGDDEAALEKDGKALQAQIASFGYTSRLISSDAEASKYWTMRRESFAVMRNHAKDRRAAPFVDDVVVNPEHLPEFLPKMRAILDKHHIFYTIAGHAGDGNFHIIPLMDFKNPATKDIILQVCDEVYALVRSYKGSFTGEHNDGILRTPYLDGMFSPEMRGLFGEVKTMFDPLNIFNPGKKISISKDYMRSHIITN